MRKILSLTTLFLFILTILVTSAACCKRTTEETVNMINETQAIQIAKTRFDEYLRDRPEMKVEDPVFMATKKQRTDKSEYWSVTVELQEQEYHYYYFEIQISVDGDNITLMTG